MRRFYNVSALLCVSVCVRARALRSNTAVTKSCLLVCFVKTFVFSYIGEIVERDLYLVSLQSRTMANKRYLSSGNNLLFECSFSLHLVYSVRDQPPVSL